VVLTSQPEVTTPSIITWMLLSWSPSQVPVGYR
jgi:hypothetical protein